jgi:hypothetical protein
MKVVKRSPRIRWAIVAVLVAPAIAIADGHRIRVNPAHAGNGAYSGWGRDSGEPGRRDQTQWGLDLRHLLATTPDGPYAGTRNLLRDSIPAATLERLAFDFSGRSGEGGVFVAGDPRHGYCTGGAPRFVVESDSGTCHLGCGHGAKAQDPDTNWWTTSFEPPFSQYPGCPTDPGGLISYIDITFDEGPAQVVIDNISATIAGRTSTVRGPGGDDDDDRD